MYVQQSHQESPLTYKIIHLVISMLLQRLRGIETSTEATIVTHLVPLALIASNGDLVEVYRALSQISRASHLEDPRTASNAILAAQTILAKGLDKRLDCADGYLMELLTLFADKGTQIQMIAMAPSETDSREKEKLAQIDGLPTNKRVREMTAWLAALLVPISMLLSHEDYHPDRSPSQELVTQFRNLWLICVTFGLSGLNGRKNLSEHEVAALGTIAIKTPALVPEGSTDFVASELEYSSVLRKDFAASVS